MEVHLRLEGGDSPESAIEFLTARGLPVRDSQDLVHNFVRETTADNRRRGAVRLAIGIVCLMIAVPVVVSAMSAEIPGEARVRGFGSALSAVGLLGGVGAWLVFRGLRFLLAGHRVVNG